MIFNALCEIKKYLAPIILSGLFSLLSVAQADTVKVLAWDDLLPSEAVAKLGKSTGTNINHNGGATEQNMSPVMSAVREALDGQRVKLPGFMVPLGGDENKVTEFLLVPYFGACMHTPPPPSNQIVYVNYPKGVSADMLYDPVWIEGPIKTGELESELAVSAYSMKAADVSLYTEK